MTASDFTIWLNGYVEMGGGRPTEQQWNMIKEHLALVFKKVTPTRISIDLPPKDDNDEIAKMVEQYKKQTKDFDPVQPPFPQPYWLENPPNPNLGVVFC